MSGISNEFNGTNEYVASEQLLNAVNVAITLGKPLLIKGEPGTGKTMLAEAISKALDKKLIIWNIKSTTKAQDGLYMYDTIQRLYDGQFGEEGVDDIARYIKLGKLGEAFESDEQVILLIDEIDKADLEFPNDLLWELDQMEFYNLSSQVVENVKANFAYTVFDTVIPRNTRLAEAPSFGMPVLEYDSKAPGSEAYRALAKEVIKNNR